MNGNFSIDFKPGSESVPRILQAIGSAGLDLYGMHLIPSCAERWTLHVDLGNAEPERVASELCSLGEVIEVIHKAGARAAG
jgi:hypothetical protein